MATVRMLSSCAERNTRMAISLRLAAISLRTGRTEGGGAAGKRDDPSDKAWGAWGWVSHGGRPGGAPVYPREAWPKSHRALTPSGYSRLRLSKARATPPTPCLDLSPASHYNAQRPPTFPAA